jgi:hypothetical protein
VSQVLGYLGSVSDTVRYFFFLFVLWISSIFCLLLVLAFLFFC